MQILASIRILQQMEHYPIFIKETTSSDTFDEIHQVVIDSISDNMASLVESGKYGAINTTDTSTKRFYVIMFKTGAYTLQENTTIGGQIMIAG